MEFSVQLSCDYPDPAYGGERLYKDMLEQAMLADRLGFESVTVTEHHLINLLMMPAPLQFAVKIAAVTRQVKVITAVVVLPLHDMRVFAGELICADIFTDHRLLVGVGRGAFEFETSRMGVPLESTRAKFDESLDVLQALLTREEVSWDGEGYKFEPLTVMPRPAADIPLMMAAVSPQAIYHSARRGFHILTTPLAGSRQLMLDQVEAFQRGNSECDDGGHGLTLSMSRVTFPARDAADAREKTRIAHTYYGRFDNVFTGPGSVSHGIVEPLPRNVPIAQTAENLLVCAPSEMVDKLGLYRECGIDRFILNINFGVAQEEMLEGIQRFAEEVMPHFSGGTANSKARRAV